MPTRRADRLTPLPLLALLALPLTAPGHAQPPAPGQGPARSIWWNQPRLVEGLGLSAEQRRHLDDLLLEQLASRREAAARYRALRQELATTLEKGSWDDARTQGKELSEVAAQLSRLETDLVIAAIQQLTPGQRKVLAADYQALLRRPWLVGGLGAGGRRQGAGQAGSPSHP